MRNDGHVPICIKEAGGVLFFFLSLPFFFCVLSFHLSFLQQADLALQIHVIFMTIDIFFFYKTVMTVRYLSSSRTTSTSRRKYFGAAKLTLGGAVDRNSFPF
uniref:Uncharacterized protein n=1 Tax=Rhipicephalus zambeziensis TaxID=60191 RepID=A0A224YFV9_9ACAR